MDYFDEDPRPKISHRFSSSTSLLPQPLPQKLNKISTSICILFSLLLLIFSFLFLKSEPLQLLSLWISLSFLIGPFAPTSITGGSITVGNGHPLPDPMLGSSDEGLSDDQPRKRRPKLRKPEPTLPGNGVAAKEFVGKLEVGNNGAKGNAGNGVGVKMVEVEQEWDEVDLELLKKQVSRHPVGEPRRWELITEAFGGRHKLESVIKTAKSFSERKGGDEDSFTKFLKQRKPLDKRAGEGGGEVVVGGGENEEKSKLKESDWSSGEDIALLNALKMFPKDMAMRWEKVAAAVPGKTKASCMKRVSELKKDFRSSKA